MSTKLMEALGMESIKFQSGILFKELTILYQEIMDSGLSESKLQQSDLLEKIEKCIKHHTGLTIQLMVDNNGPAVMVPQVNKNHAFIQEWIREYMDDQDVYSIMKKAGGIIHGSVDLNNSKVTGVFSEISSQIFMPYEWLMGKLKTTAEENAAVTLHEVGHLFTYYEYISRSVTTNQVLAALHRGYADADTVDKRKTILVNAKKALQLKQEGIDELAKSTNVEVVSSVILNSMVEKSRSELGINIYDMNSWEYLADEFAARHQSGKHLITALDKIYKKYGHMSYRNKSLYIAFEAMKATIMIGGLLSIPFTGGVGFMISLYGLILVSQDSDVIIYDEPEARMRRIKQQIIQALKDKTLKHDEIMRMNENIKTIDTILENVKDKRQWFGVLYDVISSQGRKNRGAIVLQQELEKIANNDLFAKASEFKTMAA